MMRTQKDWISFKTKFRGVAIRKGFRPALAGPRPSEEALMVPDPSDATGCSQVPETPNQIAARLAQWDTANSLCWAYLQDYCDDEAASVLRGCRDEDGRHGWELLEARYDSKSTSSTLMLLMALFTFKMATGVEEHVTAWKEKIRELTQHTIRLPSQLLCALYLHSLAPIFEPFVTAQMMKDKLDPEILYQQSIDFEKSKKLRHGEANNDHVALAAADNQTKECSAQPASAQMPCAGCGHPYHCQRECFKKGGGLSHLSYEERQDWLELKRRRRERKHESGDMPRCKRQRADNSSDDEE